MQKMKKLLSVLLCLAMLLSNMPMAFAATEDAVYAKITSETEFTTGSYVMVVSSGYAPGALDGTWVSAVKPTISGDTVTDPAGGVWTLTVNGSTVKITDANGVSIKPKASNTNGIASGAFDWKWTFADGVFTFAAEAETVTLASNATAGQDYTNKFRAYKNTTVTGANYLSEFTLYKLADGTDPVPPVVEPEVTEPVATEPVVTEPVVTEPVVEPTEPADGTVLTIAEAIAMGAAKEHNTYTTNKYKVTGVITEVYNTVYGNMKITDEAGNILTIYGTYDADGTNRYDAMAEKPVAGATVTIYGVVGQYNGTPQIKNGWIVEHIPGEPVETEPAEPELPDGTELTIEEAIAMGAAKEHNTYTTNKYMVTGVITEVYNTMYGNMKLTDETGNILTIYGTYDADGTNRYDAMATQPVAGDTVTIYGIVGQYNGTPQIKNGWIVKHAPATSEPEVTEPVVTEPEVTEPSVEPTEPSVPEVTEPSVPEVTEPAGEKVLTITEAVAMGEAMESNVYTEEKYTVTGVVSGISNSQYGNLYIKDADGNSLLIYGTYSADGSVRYDALEVKPVTGDTITVTGIIGNYNGTAQMKNGWIQEVVVGEHEVVDPDGTVLTVEQAIAKGAAMAHNTYTTTKYQVTGVITEVYNTQYGNMKITDEAGNILTIYGTYDADGSNRYDAMATQPVAGDTVTVLGIIGQYNGTAQMKNGWIVKHTPATSEPEVTEPVETEPVETEPVETEPADGTELTIAEAIAMGAAKEHNTYTTNKYNVTGVITEVYNTQYGNMKLTDEAGNILTIYGTFDADGTNRYDAMDIQPVAGDTVTIYGIVGQYNNVPQIKNGWIVKHIPATSEPEVTEPSVEPTEPEVTEPSVEPTTPSEPTDKNVLTIPEAIALGAAQEDNVHTEEKYTVTGVVSSVTNSQYGNLYIQDAEGNTLLVYGTWSADGTTRYDAMEVKPEAGDTITVTGVIGNYKGTPQMKNGWVQNIVDGEPEEEDPEGTELTIEEAAKMGSAMAHNTFTAVKYKVTGVITELQSTMYGNMTIADAAGNTLFIYGTYDADGTNRYDAMEVKPGVGDVVTLLGVIGQYNGTAQMKNGWILERVVPEVDPEQTKLSIADAFVLGAGMEHNAFTSVCYSVTGVITKIVNDVQGNLYITDENGNSLYIYGTYDADGSNRYDAMEVKPVVGDTVTLYGIIGRYGETPEMKNGRVVAHTPAQTAPEAPAGSTIFSVSVDKTEIHRGDEVTVTVTLVGENAFTSVGYIPAMSEFFTVVSGEVLLSGAMLSEWSNIDGGVALFTSSAVHTGDVFRFVIKIKDDAAFGEFSLTEMISMNNGQTAVPTFLSEQTLKVVCDHQPTDFVGLTNLQHKCVCSVCNEILIRDHNYEYVNGTCLDCGQRLKVQVLFKYEDGTIISENYYYFGDTVVVPEAPAVPESLGDMYEFAGWDKEIVAVNGDAVYVAQFKLKYTRGDVNGDLSVNDADAMYLLRYTLFGEGRYPINQSGDMNGDGAVNDADAMYLLRYTLFGDTRYPLH